VTLRTVIIAICAVLVVLAIVEAVTGWGGAVLIACEAAIVLALIVFERSRYQPKVDRSSGAWKPTGERFEDPTSGETVEVYENPQTGERDYRRSA
jgi:sugar phosphate permease